MREPMWKYLVGINVGVVSLLNQIVIIYKSFFGEGNQVNSERSGLDPHQA